MLLGAILLSGCRTDVLISESRHVPKHPRFSIQPGDYSGTKLLDFNAVYYTVHDTRRKEGTTTSYNYYRFWPSGHMIADYADHLPSRTEAEDFTHAYVGFFRLDGANISMELFAPNPGIGQWDYGTMSGTLADGTVIVTVSRIGAMVATQRTVFLKYHIDGFERQPDW